MNTRTLLSLLLLFTLIGCGSTKKSNKKSKSHQSSGTAQTDGASSDGTSSDGTSSDGTSSDGTSSDGTDGDGTDGDGTDGDGTDGDGTDGDGTDGDGTDGDGTDGEGTDGDGTDGDGTDGTEPEECNKTRSLISNTYGTADFGDLNIEIYSDNTVAGDYSYDGYEGTIEGSFDKDSLTIEGTYYEKKKRLIFTSEEFGSFVFKFKVTDCKTVEVLESQYVEDGKDNWENWGLTVK